MAQNIPLWWHEPAHPGVIQQLSDVVSVYRAIREKVQPQIDKAFDEASRQIGFVVATTLPVAITVDDKGKVTAVTIGGQFKGTLFERELAKAFTPLIGQNVAGVSPGTYQLYAIWQAALSLVLQHYWLEPAQPGTVLGTGDLQVQAFKRPPGTQEPAHFLDATIQLTAEDTIVIAAIDQVYPELRLAERIAAARTATRSVRVNPNVQERVQFRQVSAYVKEPPHSPASSLLQNDSFVAALRDLIEKFNG
ncbi:MAG: hypothetical protein WAK63_00400 [Xanthobacteraceae bacterium]